MRKVIESGRAPNLRSLGQTGTVTWNAYGGGEVGTPTEQVTYSGPGWTTIFTGVWRNRHGVADNRFRGNRIAEWPHFMRRLRDLYPKSWSASLCDWPEIHKFIVGASVSEGRPFLDFEFLATPDPALRGKDLAQRDAELTARAVQHLQVANPDVMFVYFNQVDEIGHAVADSTGRFSPDSSPYLDGIAQVDKHVGELVAAVRGRASFPEENWLILATTDHGGRGTGHGGQSLEERTIWMIANGGNAPHGQEEKGPVPQTAIAPTVFTHLGIPIDPAWAWEAKPFAVSTNQKPASPSVP